MKHILMIGTGGTIASLPGGEGLEPQRSDVMERELEQLRAYYDITVRDVMCLDSSNITPEEWQHIARELFEHREGFDGIVVSGEECLLKPDKAIYNCLLERYGLQPEESIFLDDNADNVAGAEAVGMKALRFESALQAEQELKECYGIEL
mgnify:CR=1 FL=1